jgi:hypothetical protein
LVFSGRDLGPGPGGLRASPPHPRGPGCSRAGRVASADAADAAGMTEVVRTVFCPCGTTMGWPYRAGPQACPSQLRKRAAPRRPPPRVPGPAGPGRSLRAVTRAPRARAGLFGPSCQGGFLSFRARTSSPSRQPGHPRGTWPRLAASRGPSPRGARVPVAALPGSACWAGHAMFPWGRGGGRRPPPPGTPSVVDKEAWGRPGRGGVVLPSPSHLRGALGATLLPISQWLNVWLSRPNESSEPGPLCHASVPASAPTDWSRNKRALWRCAVSASLRIPIARGRISMTRRRGGAPGPATRLLSLHGYGGPPGGRGRPGPGAARAPRACAPGDRMARPRRCGSHRCNSDATFKLRRNPKN